MASVGSAQRQHTRFGQSDAASSLTPTSGAYAETSFARTPLSSHFGPFAVLGRALRLHFGRLSLACSTSSSIEQSAETGDKKGERAEFRVGTGCTARDTGLRQPLHAVPIAGFSRDAVPGRLLAFMKRRRVTGGSPARTFASLGHSMTLGMWGFPPSVRLSGTKVVRMIRCRSAGRRWCFPG